MSSTTTPSEAIARAEAFASVHRRLLASDEHVTFGRFALLRPLGQGAQGRVYLAFDPTLEREVALKLISAEGSQAQRRALLEGRALARLRHPNLVQIHDVVQDGSAVGLAMEPIDGATLRKWCQDHRDVAAIVDVMVAVGDGLAALHAEGLVHRDIKPSNVVVDATDSPRIIDLGLAREVQQESSRRLRSGTPGYLAPEQLDGIDVGPAADQYAWAVMFWEALSGSKPVTARARAPMIPRRLQRILRRCLSMLPARRYPDMAAVLRDIEGWRRGRRWRRGGAAAVAGILGVAGLLVAFTPHDQCAATSPALAQLWDSTRSEALETQLASLSIPTAVELAQRMTDELDADYIGLVQTQRWVCEQQAAGQAMSDEAFCVRQAAAEFATTVQTLSTLDAAALPDGADMVGRMAQPRACQSRPGPKPNVPDANDLVALASRRGALQGVANACAVLGPDACRQRFSELGVEAIDASDCTIRPFAEFERGRGLMGAGDAEAAFALLTQSAWSAESCGASALEFRAKRHAAGLAASRGDLKQAQWWLAAAEAASRRTGDDDYRRGELGLTRGMVTALAGDPGKSVDELRDAIASLEPQAAVAGSTLAVAYINLGQSARQAGQYGDAVDAIERGLRLHEKRLGPNHPDVGHTLTSLSIALHQAGRTDDAVRTLDRAIAVFELWAGQHSAALAQALNNRGLMQRAVGKLADAVESFQRALAVATDQDEATRISALQNLGGAQAMQGELDAAATTLLGAHERAALRWAEPHPEKDRIAVSLAGVHLRRAAFSEAAALACPASDRTRQRLGADHRSAVRVAALCATADQSRGEDVSVVARFAADQAVVDAGAASSDRGALRLALAKSLWNTGQTQRGVMMARGAVDDLADDADGRAEVQAWLALVDSR